MRTTVDIPNEIFRELKSLAALKGMSLKEILQTAIEHELANAKKTPLVRDKVKFPILKSKEPGTLHLTNADIEDLLT